MRMTLPGGLASVAAPTAPGSSTDISLRKADYVPFRIDAACIAGTLPAYGEAARGDGLIAFTATCAQGSIVQSGFAEIEKTPDGNYTFEAVGR